MSSISQFESERIFNNVKFPILLKYSFSVILFPSNLKSCNLLKSWKPAQQKKNINMNFKYNKYKIINLPWENHKYLPPATIVPLMLYFKT